MTKHKNHSYAFIIGMLKIFLFLLLEKWPRSMLSPVSVTVRNTITDFAIFISSLLSNG